MSHRLAIIDVDGVLVDTAVRFSRASDAKTAVFQQHIAESDPEKVKSIVKQAESEFWRVAFTPHLLNLDEPISGAYEALDLIEMAGYDVVLLSSRPESLREETLRWFWDRQAAIYDRIYAGHLYLKTPAFQYTKTATWKAGIAQMLVGVRGPERVLFVDDDEKNRNAILAHAASYPLWQVAEGLDAAVNLLYPHREEKQG